MGTLGVQEMMVIFLLALVLFGPKKLPELGRTIGKALTEFRRASSDLRSTFEREMQNLERESDSLKQVADKTATDVYDHAVNYTYPYDEQGHALPPAENDLSVSPATDHPPAVGASEVPGAESHGTPAAEPPQEAEVVGVAPAPLPPVEGTVARNGAPEASQHS